MAGVAKAKLSGSTDGRDVLVVATASAGTLIHTAVTGVVSGTFDEIWLYAYNSDTVLRVLVIQFGGTTAVNDDIKVSIPPQSGLVPVVPGLILQNGSVVRAYCATANVLTVGGYVNAITA